MAPPSVPALLLTTVLFLTVNMSRSVVSDQIPPPGPSALFPAMRLFTIVGPLFGKQPIPKPSGQQLLKPTGVLTLLDVTLVAGKVVFECLIDGSVVASNPPGTNYNLSSRIHHGLTGSPSAKLTSPTSSFKDTSGTIDTKIVAP